jgi:2-(1,2-epoxy-1,2-dihydrophenyl)acetyl-CoA isomerase
MKIKCPQGNFSFFSAHLDGEVLHVRFRKNLLEHLANLSKRDMISDFANQVSKSGDVKVILLNSDFRETGCEAYTKFFLKEKQTNHLTDLHKLCNLTSQFVLGLMGIDQVVIHACQGNVISLFLNISLACDYRIAADNTIFCNPYLDLGLIPMGGGPFFLSRMMGTGNLWETLLLNKEVDAQKALTLGLVDCVVPSSDLDKTALELAQRFADSNAGTLAGLKRLVNFSKRDLAAYFKLEKEEIFKRFNSHDVATRLMN